MTTQLHTERRATCLVFTLHSPDGCHTLSHAVCAAGVEAFNTAETQPDVRALVIHCDGRFAAQEAPDAVPRWIDTLRASPKPVVAAVDGHVSGPAWALVLACDLVVAAQDARFMPGRSAVAQAMSQALPHQQALEWLWLAPPLAAARLHALGLVNHLSDSGQALPAALAWCERLSTLEAGVVAAGKELVHRAAEPARALQLTLERELLHMTPARPDTARDDATPGT